MDRSPGLASLYSSAFPSEDSGICSFIRITVAGTARNFHPIPTAGFPPAFLTHQRTLFSSLIITNKPSGVNSLFA